MLNYSIKDFEGTKVLEISGNLTSSSVDMFYDIVVRLTEKESIMINIENVGLISLAGLNTLVDVSQMAKRKGKRIILLWPGDELKKLAETMEVYYSLIFAESLEEGKTKISFFV